MGEDKQGMPNLSFRNPNQPPPPNITSNYSNQLPSDVGFNPRKTFDISTSNRGLNKLFNEKGRSQRGFLQSSFSGGFGQNFLEHIPVNKSLVLGANKRPLHSSSRQTMTTNNSLQRRNFNPQTNQRFKHVSSRKLVNNKKPKKKKDKKLKATSLRYKNKDIDIYSFKKVYKNMTNDYPNLEIINFQNNKFRGNIANIINEVIPKRRQNQMTLDLRNNVFFNMTERDLENLKEICRLKNVVVYF